MNRYYLLMNIAFGYSKAEDYNLTLTEEDEKIIRSYRLFDIASGRATAEDYNLILTDEEKENIRKDREVIKIAEANGNPFILYAPDEDWCFMNREYRLIGIAMGRLNPKECGIVLTDDDRKSIQEYRDIAKKADEEGKFFIFYAPDEDWLSFAAACPMGIS